jgi:hypothetical protein
MQVDPRGQPGGFFGGSQMDTTSSPFLWGAGGKRRSMDDIALERRLAAQQMQTGADFSPLQHWTQGLARVGNGLAGGLRMRGADRDAEEARTAQQQIIEALVSGQGAEGSDPNAIIAQALADPELRQVGMSVLESRQPKARNPYRQEDNAGNVWEMGEDGAFKLIFTDLAPKQFLQDGQLVTVTNPYAVQGAAPSGAPVAPPPEAIQELMRDPSPDAMREFDEAFGPGASQQLMGARENFTASTGNSGPVITRGQAEAMIAEKGRGFFDEWAARNNVTVGN